MGIWERDCDCCSWTAIAIWVAVVAVLAGVLAVLIIAFAVFKPPTAMADDATLTRFTLSASPNNTSSSNPQLQLISYNATVTLSLHNPNIYRLISYTALTTAFSFNGTRFDEGTVQPFEQGRGKTTTLKITVGGVDKALPKLSAAGPAEYAKEKEAGAFQVEARLDGLMEYKGRSKKCPVAVICPLKLQLVDPDVASTVFQRTKCTILRAKTSGC